MDLFMLALLALAASRATHLVADDMLPFGWVRDWFASRPSAFPRYVAIGLGCTFCVSIWAGAAAAGLAQWQGWAPAGGWEFMVLWFAFAQAIVLIEGAVEALMGSDGDVG